MKRCDTRKMTLLIKFEECSCVRKPVISFMFSIHLPVIFSVGFIGKNVWKTK